MKIAYLSSSTLISDSANSVHVTKMCAAFAKAGHDVTLFGYQGSGENEDAVLSYYNVLAPFNITRFTKAEEAGAFLNALKKLPFIRLGGLPALRFGSCGLKKHLLKYGRPDLLFSRNMYWLYGARGYAPFIYESHCPPQNAAQKIIEKRLLAHPNCKGLVVISDKLAEIYREVLPESAEKLIIAHDGADDPDPALALESGRALKNIGYVGHLYKGRGMEIILECAKALPDMNFHIVGGQAELIESYKQGGAPENMIFHGHLPQAALQEHYRNFDAVLAPYQRKVSVHGNAGDTSAFMSPLKIFEYMSWGLPILCSDMPVLREVLRDDENALMLEPDDPQSWITALQSLQNEPEMRQKLAHGARSDFLNHYTWDKRAAAILGQALVG